MRTPAIAAAMIAAALHLPAMAQDDAKPEGDAAPDAAAEGAAEGTAAPAEGQAAPAPVPEPDYNGTASGMVSGVGLNVPVVCTGFGDGGSVTVQSDPQGADDANGDGQIVDITASQDGSITLTLLAGNALVNLSDTSAKVGPTSLTYAITMTYVGGGEDKVDLTVNCN